MFFKDISESYSQLGEGKTILKELTILSDDHNAKDYSKMIELASLLDFGLSVNPELAQTEKGKKFIKAFVEEYKNYLKDKKLISFSNNVKEPININIKSLLTTQEEIEAWNDSLLDIISSEYKEMTLKVLKPRLSGLILSLSRIDPQE